MTLPQSRVRVNTIEGSDGSSPVIISYGATVPSGSSFQVLGDISISGIITATSFSGDGSGLTNINIIGKQKAIAVNFIVD